MAVNNRSWWCMITQTHELLHLSARAEHPCCDLNCSTGVSWIKLPSSDSGSVCEQNLHKKPIGSAESHGSFQPLADKPVHTRILQVTTAVMERKTWRWTPTQWCPLACCTLTTGLFSFLMRCSHTQVEQWISPQLIWLYHVQKKLLWKKSSRERRNQPWVSVSEFWTYHWGRWGFWQDSRKCTCLPEWWRRWWQSGPEGLHRLG